MNPDTDSGVSGIHRKTHCLPDHHSGEGESQRRCYLLLRSACQVSRCSPLSRKVKGPSPRSSQCTLSHFSIMVDSHHGERQMWMKCHPCREFPFFLICCLCEHGCTAASDRQIHASSPVVRRRVFRVCLCISLKPVGWSLLVAQSRPLSEVENRSVMYSGFNSTFPHGSEVATSEGG